LNGAHLFQQGAQADADCQGRSKDKDAHHHMSGL
jgi:hypothetical protein